MANLLPDFTASIGELGDTLRTKRMQDRRMGELETLSDLYKKTAQSSPAAGAGVLSQDEINFNAQGIKSGDVNPNKAVEGTKADIASITNMLQYNAYFSPDPVVRQSAIDTLTGIKKMSMAWDATDYKKDQELIRNMRLEEYKSQLRKGELGIKGKQALTEIEARGDQQRLVKEMEDKNKKDMSKFMITQDFIIGGDMAPIGAAIADYKNSHVGTRVPIVGAYVGKSPDEVSSETAKDLQKNLDAKEGGVSESKLNAQLYDITSKIEQSWQNKFPGLWQTLNEDRKKEIVHNTFWTLYSSNGSTSIPGKDGKVIPLKFQFQYSPLDTKLSGGIASSTPDASSKQPSSQDIYTLSQVLANPAGKDGSSLYTAEFRRKYVETFNKTYGQNIALPK